MYLSCSSEAFLRVIAWQCPIFFHGVKVGLREKFKSPSCKIRFLTVSIACVASARALLGIKTKDRSKWQNTPSGHSKNKGF